VSAGSDLYSIGVILYELLTGRVPFDADAAVTIALKHVSEAPTAPSAINSAIPPELDQVVMWALNKNPADRPASADQFINALEQVRGLIVAGRQGQRTASIAALAGVGAAALPAAAAAAAVDSMPAPGEVVPGANGAGALAEEEPSPDEPQHRPRRWLWIAALVALLLVGGGLAAYLLTRPVKKAVPVVVGEQVNVARTQLQNAGFINVSVINVTNGEPSGTVISQDPVGGTKANVESTMSLTVSQGPGSTTVPSVKGLTVNEAKQVLMRARLTPGRVVSLTSTLYAAGQVTGTDPAAGAAPFVGTTVTIFVSSGRPLVTVPDVTGESESAAKSTLESQGFQVGSVGTQTTTSARAGDVLSQTPAGGSQVAQGTTVDLVVATGSNAPTSATVPNVTGQKQGPATSALTGAGFKVQVNTQTVGNQNQDGAVLSQAPGGGSSANKGSTVTITVGKFQAPTTSTKTNTSPTTHTSTSPTTTTKRSHSSTST
jgi:serine/threonine-protein kinase